jgi:hypothetical protein
MMIDLECSVVLAPISGSNSAVSKSVPEEPVSSGTSHEITSTVPGSRKSLLLETANKSDNTGVAQKTKHATKSPRRKPVIVNTENPLTNYFKPVSITLTADDDEIESSRKGGARTIHLSMESSDSSVNIATPIPEPNVCLQSSETAHDPQQIVSNHTEVLEDGQVPSVASVEIPATTKESSIKCEVPGWRQMLSPVKVVVEKIEDFILPKTFSALETTPPLNVEHDKELPSHGVSSSSRRKTKSPLKRNAGDPKLPPFKSNSRTIQHMQTKEQCMELMSKDKLSKSSSRLNKRKESEEMRPLKRSARSHGGKYGSSGHVMKVTVGEAIPNPETASGDRTSPSLLPAVSRRMSRSKTKRKSGNTESKIIENNLATPQKSEFSELSTAESQHKPLLHSHEILDGMKANRHNSSKSRKSLSIKDLNECGQVKIDENDSLPACNKEKAFGIEISKQHDDSSKTNVREVSGDTYKGSEPSDSASIVAVDVEVCRQNMVNSAESFILHVEMQETVQKPISQTVLNDATCTSTGREVKSAKSTFCNTELFKSNSEAQADSVKFTKENISDSNGASKASPRKLQVTNTEVSKQGTMDSLQQVHDEMPASGVKISDSGTSNNSDFIEVGLQNETISHLETSADTETSKDEACNMVKEGCSKAIEPATEGSNSHTSSESLTSNDNIDKRDVKSMLLKMKNDPRIEKTSKLEVEDEKEISSNDADRELSVGCRKSTSKLKSSVASLGSDGTGMDQDKPADILGCEIACNVKMDTPLGPEGLSAERNELHVPEVEHGSNVQHVPTEDVCTKRRKRRVCRMGCENDLKTVQVSLRSESSHLEQSRSDTTVTEGNLVSLLEDYRKDCSTRNPEICAASATTEEIIVFNVTKTTPMLTSTEAAAVTVPILAAIVTADSPNAMNILPTSVEKETEPIYSCEDISEELNENMSNFCKEEYSPVGKVISGEKVVPRQRTYYSAVNKAKPVLGVVPRKLRSSTSKQMPLGSCVQVKTNRRVNKKPQISDQPKELGDRTCVEVSDVAVLSQKHITETDGMNKLDLKTSLESAKTTSCVSELEVTLSCVEIPHATTGPEGAQTDSQKVTDSEVVIENSQDSSAASAFIVSRYPLIHKCSVSVRRIDTTLEPGTMIDISQGDQKLMVLTPSDPSSPFKVYSPEKRTLNAGQEEKSEKEGSEMERAIKIVVKTDAAEPRSKQIVGILTTKECVPAVTSAGALRPRSRQQTSTTIPEVSFVATNVSGPPKLRQRKSNTLKYVDNVLHIVAETACTKLKNTFDKHGTQDEITPVTMSNGSKPVSRQQFDKSKPVDTKEQTDLLRTDDSISATIRDDTLEFRHKADVSTVGKEDMSKLQLKKQINIPRSEDGISSVCKEDALKSRAKRISIPELKETSILKGDSKHSLPVQSRKRLADSDRVPCEVHRGKVDSSLDDYIDTGGSKIKRLSQNFENVRAKSACDCSPMSSPSKAKFSNGRERDKTPSPPSSKSLLSSPSSLLQAFASPLGSLELNQSHRSDHKHPSSSRAQYLVGLAVAVNDVESPQALSPVLPRKPEEARRIIAASPPSLPLPRKKLEYGMSDGDDESGAPPVERQVPFAHV